MFDEGLERGSCVCDVCARTQKQLAALHSTPVRAQQETIVKPLHLGFVHGYVRWTRDQDGSACECKEWLHLLGLLVAPREPDQSINCFYKGFYKVGS